MRTIFLPFRGRSSRSGPDRSSTQDRRPARRLLAVIAVTGIALPAQTHTQTIDPKGTFLRTDSTDTPYPPLVVDLGSLGICPGQSILIRTLGNFLWNQGQALEGDRAVAVFSSSSTVLGPSLRIRVPNAIQTAAAAYVTAPTLRESLATDIPEDFVVSPLGIVVTVPATGTGASPLLIIGADDVFWGDNMDPQQDFAIRIEATGPPVRNTGRVVAVYDDWTLSNTGFRAAGTSAMAFARNVGRFLSSNTYGRFLVYSNDFGLRESTLRDAMIGVGHEWIADTGIRFDVPTLREFDGVYVLGDVGPSFPSSAANSVLIDYVESGGSVYVGAGTAVFGPAMNSFAQHFGFTFGGLDGSQGLFALPSTHPIACNVDRIYAWNGNTMALTGGGVVTPDVIAPGRVLAAEAPAARVELDVSPTNPTPHATVVFGLSGAPAGGLVAIVADTLVGQAIAPQILWFGVMPPNGSWITTVTVPPGLAPSSLGVVGATLSPSARIAYSRRTTIGFR